MAKKKLTTQRGFTIVELMTAVLVASIVIFGIAIILVDSQRGWNNMYNRIYSDVVTDGYVARRTFDVTMRRASREKFLVDGAGSWIEVYYYAGSGSTSVDRYARFFVSGSQLNIEYGKLNPRETLSIQTISENVSSCVFRDSGRSAQMILTLDNGSQTATVVSSAVMHNQ